MQIHPICLKCRTSPSNVILYVHFPKVTNRFQVLNVLYVCFLFSTRCSVYQCPQTAHTLTETQNIHNVAAKNNLRGVTNFKVGV